MSECSIPIRNGPHRLICVIFYLFLFAPPVCARDASGSLRFARCSFLEQYRLKLVGCTFSFSIAVLNINQTTTLQITKAKLIDTSMIDGLMTVRSPTKHQNRAVACAPGFLRKHIKP